MCVYTGYLSDKSLALEYGTVPCGVLHEIGESDWQLPYLQRKPRWRSVKPGYLDFQYLQSSYSCIHSGALKMTAKGWVACHHCT